MPVVKGVVCGDGSVEVAGPGDWKRLEKARGAPSCSWGLHPEFVGPRHFPVGPKVRLR